jgi:hypothetical protein
MFGYLVMMTWINLVIVDLVNICEKVLHNFLLNYQFDTMLCISFWVVTIMTNNATINSTSVVCCKTSFNLCHPQNSFCNLISRPKLESRLLFNAFMYHFFNILQGFIWENNPKRRFTWMITCKDLWTTCWMKGYNSSRKSWNVIHSL